MKTIIGQLRYIGILQFNVPCIRLSAMPSIYNNSCYLSIVHHITSIIKYVDLVKMSHNYLHFLKQNKIN